MLRVGEFQNLMCALGLGLQQMVQRDSTNTVEYLPIRVTLVGEKQDLEREDMLCGKEDKVIFP